MTDPDCPQCKGCGRVADLPQFPKPAWDAWENRPKAGPDPMTDFVKPVPCPRCHPLEEAVTEKPSDLVLETGVVSYREEEAVTGLGSLTFVRNYATDLRSKAVEYRKRADTAEQLAKVAEQLTPGSDAERAFVEFIKTQGIEL